MRPGSRGGNMPGTSGGMPPGTGFRPGSGMSRKPPGTGRLRTGVAPSGPGTEAAQGVALSASISVLDRPVTGQGVMGMKTQGLGTGRLVEDNSYYIGLLRKKITDVSTETRKLRTEIEQQSKDNSSYTQLEKKYETLSKEKERLEGQLADYNLAMDKSRTSTDPEDVHQQATHLVEKNRQTGQELDRVFKSRKQKEEDNAKVEDQIEAQYSAIQSRINELEPGKLRAYNELLSKQREFQDRTMHCESKLNEVNEKIRHYENDDKTNIHRKEFSTLEKTYRTLKRDMEGLNEELEISNLDPKDAHTKFVARVNSLKMNTKALDEKLLLMKTEITGMKKVFEDLASTTEEDSSEAAKYELLHKRDQDMTAFMDKFDETQEHVRLEQQTVRDVICGLLEHIGRGLDESSQMPSQAALGEMEDQKTFKERNLATAQKTMESLLAEKRKRERDLDLLRISEPKLLKELTNLKENISRMHRDMQGFQDIEGMRRAFEVTKRGLSEVKVSYIKRRDTMRQQVQVVSSEYEGLKKALNAHETGRELDDNEKRLKHNERTIFELKDFVETKSRETDYEALKGGCVKMLDVINSLNVKKMLGTPGQQFSGK